MWSRICKRIYLKLGVCVTRPRNCCIGLLLLGLIFCTFLLRFVLQRPVNCVASFPLASSVPSVPITSSVFHATTKKVSLHRPANVEDYVSYGNAFEDNRRLGNQIFNFASIVYVAHLTGRRPAMLTKDAMKFTTELERTFDLSEVDRFDDMCPCYLALERGHGMFDTQLQDLATKDNELVRNKSILVSGSRQSWKYVRPIDRKLRQLLRFLPHVQKQADNFLDVNTPPSWKNLYYVRVGVHVRHGDVLAPAKVRFGHSTPNETYFYNAMNYFANKYPRVQFILCSDDIKWTQEYITQDMYNTTTVNVTYKVGSHSAAEDLALLSNCDHLIISTGSYGWWAAWFTRGTAVYYQNWPTPNTPFYHYVKKSDYFWPDWIPME